MMQTSTTSKVTTEHLSRNAYLYVRQSTLRQVSPITRNRGYPIIHPRFAPRPESGS